MKSNLNRRWILAVGAVLAGAMGFAGARVAAQENQPGAASPAGMSRDSGQMEKRLEQMSELLLATQRQMEQSRAQMAVLSEEIEAMRRQMALTGAAVPGASPGTESSSAELAEKVAQQEEQLEVQQAEIRQHEQTKVETASKYSLHLYGLILFNAYSNAGVVDNINLPSIALPRAGGTSHGSVGATMRQTVLGFHADGPKVFGARSSADLSSDFFSNVTYDFYGNSVGNLRLRRADVGLDWTRDSLHAGVDTPLISPNSPTSYATVGVPALGWAGNLWNWSTQMRYTHTLQVREGQQIALEAGLWDPPVIGVSSTNASPAVSPGEASRRPGVEGRVSYHSRGEGRPAAFGVGAYGGSESYAGGAHVRTWAVTGDWDVPLAPRLRVTGEIYRGVGLGGFGGGAYKDVLSGLDETGTARTIGLNAAGGWAQAKATLPKSVEVNIAYGQDGAFAADFRSLDTYGSSYPLELSARNRMMFGNVVYRPKTYLILSPEYRRIEGWQTTGPKRMANVYTFSAGYQF